MFVIGRNYQGSKNDSNTHDDDYDESGWPEKIVNGTFGLVRLPGLQPEGKGGHHAQIPPDTVFELYYERSKSHISPASLDGGKTQDVHPVSNADISRTRDDSKANESIEKTAGVKTIDKDLGKESVTDKVETGWLDPQGIGLSLIHI